MGGGRDAAASCHVMRRLCAFAGNNGLSLAVAVRLHKNTKRIHGVHCVSYF